MKRRAAQGSNPAREETHHASQQTMRTQPDNQKRGEEVPRRQLRAARARLRKLPGLSVASAVLAAAWIAAGCASSSAAHKREVRVLTWNVYAGGELERVLALDPADPGYATNLAATVTGIYREILALDPPARMRAIAREIGRLRPDLVGLQEVYCLEKAPALGSQPGPFSVAFDYLQLLTNALAANGAPYAVATLAAEARITMPMLDPQTGEPAFGRVTDREVILARADLPASQLRLENPQSGRYQHILELPAAQLAVTRGWCAVDATARGQTFRFICTHLEDDKSPDIQRLQAQELLDGPAKSAWPVVLVGDFNADPLHRNGTTTHDQFSQAGFRDTWNALHPASPRGGLTWGHDGRLADPGQRFVWRLDLVLSRGARLVPRKIAVSDPRLNRTKPPLWPSDHAAVAADFRILPAPAAEPGGRAGQPLR
jgi:endonuclease/exonuclease/phosphatase family metal-dependent hydrolase